MLEYAQYVAGPFAGMLLADLGADVVKVEPPDGRRLASLRAVRRRREPLLLRAEPQQALGRARPQGPMRAALASRALIRTADAVLHNLPPERARAFELDRELGPDGQPGRRLVLCLGAGQRRPGGVADRLRPRRPGPVRTAAGQRAGLRRGPPACGRDRHGRFHRRAAGGDRRARRGRGPRAFGGPCRPATGGLAARRGAGGSGAKVRLGARTRSTPERARATSRRSPPRTIWSATPGPSVPPTSSSPTTAPTPPRMGSSCSPACASRQRLAAAAVLGLEDPWAANPQAPPG